MVPVWNQHPYGTNNSFCANLNDVGTYVIGLLGINIMYDTNNSFCANLNGVGTYIIGIFKIHHIKKSIN